MRINPLHDLVPARCLARTRKGTFCQTFPITWKKRCRMHGGAKGSGAQKGNRNAFKHGKYSAEYLAQRKYRKELLRDARILLGRIR
mgnify:CR=1 FL=1